MSQSPITPAMASYMSDVRIPLRLACITESGWPLVVSLWFLYDDGKLYCATHKDARIAGYLGGQPRCAFEVAGDQPPYCGVRGRALATIDPTQGEEILRRLLQRYLGGTDNELARWLLSRAADEIAIELTPVTAFAWNYSQRMRDIAGAEAEKPCP
jgi:nitroimidazol reductase NimA-like FMN-containing flavoprotein (pyridoxamine 5'-phosphate oxidase superfamily)